MMFKMCEIPKCYQHISNFMQIPLLIVRMCNYHIIKYRELSPGAIITPVYLIAHNNINRVI